MKPKPSPSEPPIEPRQLSMTLAAPTLRMMSRNEHHAVLVALAGLLLEAAGTGQGSSETVPALPHGRAGLQPRPRRAVPLATHLLTTNRLYRIIQQIC